MIAISDRELITRSRGGDVEAFGELVRRYQGSIYNVCYRMMHERYEAEDMTQETFLRIYQRLHLFDLERPFDPWARRVAANLCLNRLSARPDSPASVDEERDAAPVDSRPESIVETRERSARLQNAFGALSPAQQAVIELRHFQELSYEEIAGVLNVPLSKVKSDLFRARKLLAEALKNEPYL